jgi:SAM-dependent methyltransferase
VGSGDGSERFHEAAYRHKRAKGQAGWDATFDLRDLACLMVSQFAPAPCPMLDIGCGGGESSAFFAGLGFTVTAFDFSSGALELARDNARRKAVDVAFLLHDMRRPLPFPDGSFGFALDHRALHCLVDAGDRRRVLQEVHRVLRPGSLWYSSTISGLPHAEDLRAAVDHATRTNRTRTRFFGEPGDILREFTDAGFEIAAHQIVSEPYIVDNLITYARRS